MSEVWLSQLIYLYKSFNYAIRCTALSEDLDRKAGLRSNRHRELLLEALSYKSAWDDYGYVGDVIVSD